nr:retrovirus-related Pol polyprotein from transposon TNT 1-94 [Tanacetum cinerariifolium]
GDKPAIGYLKPFGCQVTILNISDYLGKFDEKADEGYIVGYSILAQRLGLAFPTHVVTNEASSIPAEKSSLVSPASTPTASAGNTPLVSPRPSASHSSKSTGKKLASSSKTPIPAGRSVSADKSILAGRSIFTDKSIPADRSISASRDTNSADRHPSKLS